MQLNVSPSTGGLTGKDCPGNRISLDAVPSLKARNGLFVQYTQDQGERLQTSNLIYDVMRSVGFAQNVILRVCE